MHNISGAAEETLDGR